MGTMRIRYKENRCIIERDITVKELSDYKNKRNLKIRGIVTIDRDLNNKHIVWRDY